MEKRLQKILSDSGYCSRRKAEELIEKGLVRVNGKAVKVGDKADTEKDTVTVCGEKIDTEAKALRYIKLYKPRGYLTSMEDAHSDKLRRKGVSYRKTG